MKRQLPNSVELTATPANDVALALVEGTPVVMYAKDLDLRFVLTNATHTGFIGQPRELVLGRTDSELFGDEAAAVEVTSREVIASGVPSVQEIELTLPDGPHTFLEVIFPIHGPTNEVIGIGGLATDITVRRRLEVALAERASELEQTLAELRRAQEQLVRQQHRAALVSQCVELLQISGSVAEGLEVLAQFAPRLLPTARVVLYTLDAETGALEHREEGRAESRSAHLPMVQTVERQQCWALRTRRVHGSVRGGSNPICRHVDGSACAATFCVPIASLEVIVAMMVIELDASNDAELSLLHAQLTAIAQSLSGAMSTVALRESLQRAALADASTSLPNLRAFQQEGTRTIARQRRAARTFALAVVRAAQRVRYVDPASDTATEQTPRRVAEVLRVGLRDSDLIGRIAPDEFAILMTDLTRANAEDRLAALADQVAASTGGQETLAVRTAVVHSDEAPGLPLDSMLSLARLQL